MLHRRRSWVALTGVVLVVAGALLLVWRAQGIQRVLFWVFYLVSLTGVAMFMRMLARRRAAGGSQQQDDVTRS